MPEMVSPPIARVTRPAPRRLSSITADRADLFGGGPTIITHPNHLSKPSDAHATALTLELAKYHLAEGSDSSSSPEDPDTGATTPDAEEAGRGITDKYAFAFDIDGVLIKGGSVIPEAVEAMKVLNGQNDYNIKVYVQMSCLELHKPTLLTLRLHSGPTYSSQTAAAKPKRSDALIYLISSRWKSLQASSFADTLP